MASDLVDGLERRLQEAIGTEAPLACTATEEVTEAVIRAACEELGSLTVDIKSNSSSAFLRGDLRYARVAASAVAVGGLRVSSTELEVTNLRVDPGSLLTSPPQLPNLARAVPLCFSLRFSQDDFNRSPLLLAAVQEVLRELVRSGVSAAIGEVLPDSSSGPLLVTLTKVEALEGGRIVLVADAEGQRADGSTLSLQGMRVRVRPLASPASKVLVLDSPELLSSFEGFGAKLEVGLPFLRAAGLPLPQPLSLTKLVVDDGAILVEGSLLLEPVDYNDLQQTLAELREAAAQNPPTAVVVDATPEAGRTPPPPPPPPGLKPGL